MGNLLPIGRFSQLCRLSIKALRYYDEIGLLKPAQIDQWSNYRYYTIEQAAIADQIRLWRATEMPIEEVRLLLTESNEWVRQQIVATHRERLHQRITEYHSALSLLEQLQIGKEHVVSYEMRIQEVVAQPVAAVRMVIPWGQLGEVLGSTFGEIAMHLAASEAPMAGAPVVLYYGMDATTNEEGNAELEIAIPVVAPILEGERVKNSTVPAGTAVTTIHMGPYHEISKAYQAIQAWLQEHGHQSAGSAWEVYMTDPESTPDPADYRTDVYWLLAS